MSGFHGNLSPPCLFLISTVNLCAGQPLLPDRSLKSGCAIGSTPLTIPVSVDSSSPARCRQDDQLAVTWCVIVRDVGQIASFLRWFVFLSSPVATLSPVSYSVPFYRGHRQDVQEDLPQPSRLQRQNQVSRTFDPHWTSGHGEGLGVSVEVDVSASRVM